MGNCCHQWSGGILACSQHFIQFFAFGLIPHLKIYSDLLGNNFIVTQHFGG
jgi:hypothetical protein